MSLFCKKKRPSRDIPRRGDWSTAPMDYYIIRPLMIPYGKTSGFVREDMGSPETRNHSRMGSTYAPISPRLRELAHRLFLFPKSRPLPVSPGVTADISGICGRTTGPPTQTSGPSGSSYRQELCQKCPLTAGTHRKTLKPRSRVFDSTERARTFNLKRMKFLLHQLSYRAIC